MGLHFCVNVSRSACTTDVHFSHRIHYSAISGERRFQRRLPLQPLEDVEVPAEQVEAYLQEAQHIEFRPGGIGIHIGVGKLEDRARQGHCRER